MAYREKKVTGITFDPLFSEKSTYQIERECIEIEG
jgi:hypothetical protein